MSSHCATRALPMEAAEKLLTVLHEVDAVRDVRALTDAMVVPTALAAD